MSLTRYLSVPLFPVHLRELPSHLILHEAPLDGVEIGGTLITASPVIHPGLTVGYRLSEGGKTLTYISDHEPVLGRDSLPESATWTSGYAIAKASDLLIHDSQYTDAEYVTHRGWGHSSISQAAEFARRAGVKRLITFHHDPDHSDQELDELHRRAGEQKAAGLELIPGKEGLSLEIG